MKYGLLKTMKKIRQNAENKQTFDLSQKIENDRKTRQNSESKQRFDLNRTIEIEGNISNG